MTDNIQAPTRIERLRSIWDTVELIVEQAVCAAETLQAGKTGPEKKAFVIATALDFLKSIEGTHHLIPTSLEGLAFQGIQFGLSLLVDKVFARLAAQGEVNQAPKAAA